MRRKHIVLIVILITVTALFLAYAIARPADGQELPDPSRMPPAPSWGPANVF